MKTVFDVENSVDGVGQQGDDLRASAGLGQGGIIARKPACDDAAGLARAQRFSQNRMKKVSYGASVFGEQLLRQPGFASDGSKIGKALRVFGKAPELQPAYNNIPQLQTGLGQKNVQTFQNDIIRPCRSFVLLLPAQRSIKHENRIESRSIFPQVERVLAVPHGGQCHVLFQTFFQNQKFFRCGAIGKQVAAVRGIKFPAGQKITQPFFYLKLLCHTASPWKYIYFH